MARRPVTIAYYVAASVLALGLVIGTTLLWMLMTRSSETSSFEVGQGTPAECPVGGRATACYQFDITNVGGVDGVASCGATATEGTEALFPNDANTIDVPLASGETQSVFVRVSPLGGDVVSEPIVACITG